MGNLQVKGPLRLGLYVDEIHRAFGHAEHQFGVGEILGQSGDFANGVAGVVGGIAVMRDVPLIAGITAHMPFTKMRARIAQRLECLGNGDSLGIKRHVRDAGDHRQAARFLDVKIILPERIREHGVAIARGGLAGLHTHTRRRTLRRGVGIAKLHAIAGESLEMRHLQHGHFGIGHRLIKGNRRAVPGPVINENEHDIGWSRFSLETQS